jgi:F-type H+-transporting ATPase subunit delta
MSTAPETRSDAPRVIPGTVLDDQASAGARTYAEAFLGAADNSGQADAAVSELREALDDVFLAHPTFSQVLVSPERSQEDRDRMIVQLFEGRAMPVVLNFLRVLNQHGRLGLLPMVVDEAQRRLDRRHRRRPVRVVSAVPLEDDQVQALRGRIAGMIGSEPVMSMEVDPSLIGGLVVQVGDEVFDTSVRSQLARLRRQVVEGKLHEVRTLLTESAIA